MSNALYTGEDVEVIIDLIDTDFADLSEVIVGVVVNKVLVKTMKKTGSGSQQVFADTGNTRRCKFRLFRSETSTWEPGMLQLEVTTVQVVSGFPDGKHNTFRANVVPFNSTLTKHV